MHTFNLKSNFSDFRSNLVCRHCSLIVHYQSCHVLKTLSPVSPLTQMWKNEQAWTREKSVKQDLLMQLQMFSVIWPFRVCKPTSSAFTTKARLITCFLPHDIIYVVDTLLQASSWHLSMTPWLHLDWTRRN